MAGGRRLAAPLLGGVRGWVYSNATSDPGITTRGMDGKIALAVVKIGPNVATLVRENTKVTPT